MPIPLPPTGTLSFLRLRKAFVSIALTGPYIVAIRVECYAGYRGEQEPTALWLGERRLEVRAVIDRWFAPGQRWFKIDADDGHLYVLRNDEASGDWEIAGYRRVREVESP